MFFLDSYTSFFFFSLRPASRLGRRRIAWIKQKTVDLLGAGIFSYTKRIMILQEFADLLKQVCIGLICHVLNCNKVAVPVAGFIKFFASALSHIISFIAKGAAILCFSGSRQINC